MKTSVPWTAPVLGRLLPEKWVEFRNLADCFCTDGSGRDRGLALLGEAGYVIKDGSLVAPASGRPLGFEI